MEDQESECEPPSQVDKTIDKGRPGLYTPRSLPVMNLLEQAMGCPVPVRRRPRRRIAVLVIVIVAMLLMSLLLLRTYVFGG
jgi:hypothetical protein